MSRDEKPGRGPVFGWVPCCSTLQGVSSKLPRDAISGSTKPRGSPWGQERIPVCPGLRHAAPVKSDPGVQLWTSLVAPSFLALWGPGVLKLLSRQGRILGNGSSGRTHPLGPGPVFLWNWVKYSRNPVQCDQGQDRAGGSR